MRLLLPAAAAALLAVALLLWSDRGRDVGGHGDAPDRTPVPAPADAGDPGGRPEPLPDLAGLATGDDDAQARLERFVEACARRGPECVAMLLERLRTRPDVSFGPWRFRDGRPVGYPSLRAALLDALARLPGAEATAGLLEVLDLTRSIDETLFIASALEARGDRRWLPVALERADAEDGPPGVRTREALVALAAGAAPLETADQVVARAPRGEEGRDPRILATALQALPFETAVDTGQRVLVDPLVTRKAKSRYVHALAERGEPAVFGRLREMLGRGRWDAGLRHELAEVATRATAFHRDRIAFGVAAANGRDAEALAIRERYHERLREVERLVRAALGDEAFEAGEPRAKALERALARRRDEMP